MGALQDGVNWTLHTAERTGEGLSQIFNGLSSTSDFNSTYLPVFAAGMVGIFALGLIGNRHTLWDMGKELLSHPKEALVSGVWSGIQMAGGAGLILLAAGTVAEYAKTGNFYESVQTTITDSWHLISSAAEYTKTTVYDPAVPHPSVESVPVVRAPSSLSP
jgi:hypothetical protein